MFRTVAVFLIITVACVTTPTQQVIQSSTELTADEVQAQFEAELTAYAATHTDSEVVAYAQARVYSMTAEAQSTTTAATIATNPLSLVISEEVLSPTGSTNMLIFTDPEGGDGYDPARFRFCIESRERECKALYDAALAESAATSITLIAACTVLSGGTVLIVCLAAALSAHLLNIAAASRKYQACSTRAFSDCQLAYGGFRK
jgi:hypothetical protein